ncbi:hypothetical protein [Ramlibacter algicola]|uniref:DUF802 domain-containing protein n=1 Tax=Ramlibacter algicola TaxID=2795217 RepID=A0A934Q2E6_9BURK|nr:hypothetical protein [Ramlibacter algicola]MBK0393691.1 hypothetical protein [Ramlibacter algicola]
MSTTRFFAAAFALGLAAIAWVAQGFVGSNWLAFAMTLGIAAVYLLGAWELRRFRADTHTLAAACDGAAPASLQDWLARVPAALRHAVRLRVDGERAGLPGPNLTPYLVGLLVMLGMLGTFLGMVVTFKGAVFALEGSTDLQAIRAALAEPIRGLGLSFGTSIAGVASSAMLGLMSAIARRERLDAARLLEQHVATTLRPFSYAHQRDEAFRALQAQASALPNVAQQLETLLDRLEARSKQLDEQLLAGQVRFHAEATQSYERLARDVGTSLQGSLVAAATAAGDSIRPVVASAMDRIAEESRRQNARLAEESRHQNEHLADSARAQVDALAASFRETSEAVVASFRDTSDSLAASFRDGNTALASTVGHTLAASQKDHAAREQQRLQAWTESLHALAGRLESQWQQLAHDTVQQMAALGGAMEAPVQRLLQTASDVPAAAAGVLAQLREEVARTAERDNVALQERTLLLDRLGTVLEEVQQASGAQRQAIATLVESTTAVLAKAGDQFGDVLEANADRTGEAAAHVAATSQQMTELARAFGEGVQQFQASNEKVLGTLAQVESTLQRSIERSDEQLAYYVAQAREVIDLSIASQADVVTAWQKLQGRGKATVVADESAA